jgi:peptide/nickel transport system permease protein
MALAQQVQLQREPGTRASLARRVAGSPALQLVARRLLTAIPVLLGVTFLTFVVMNLVPGNPAQLILGINASPAAIHKLDVQLGLNHPFWDRYWLWLDGLLHGNLGIAYSNQQSVNTDIAQYLPVTCWLLLYALVAALVLGVIVAVLAARKPNGLFDRLSLVVSMIGLSFAPYALALCLGWLFAVKLGWFHIIDNSLGGNPFTAIKNLTLPAASIGFGLFSVYTRLLRADIIEQMEREDYIVTAKAKGVAPWRVLVVHATKNSLFTLITLVALNLGTLIGATAIIEPIFSLPGIGAELINAIGTNDLPLIEGIVVVFALVTVAGNLLADVLYTVLDPRIRYGRSVS